MIGIGKVANTVKRIFVILLECIKSSMRDNCVLGQQIPTNISQIGTHHI